MGNQESKYYFWDLQRLEEGLDPAEDKKLKRPRGRKPKGGAMFDSLGPLADLKRAESVQSSEGAGGSTRTFFTRTFPSSKLIC